MDNYLIVNDDIEKDREEELFFRLIQIQLQVEVIIDNIKNETLTIHELKGRITIIKELLAWYVNSNNVIELKVRLNELPSLLSTSEKMELISALFICKKYVSKMEKLLCTLNGDGNISLIKDIIYEKFMILSDLLSDYNAKKEYPHLIQDAIKPYQWIKYS